MLSVAIFVNAREQAPLRSRLAREASAGTRAGAFAFATATGVHAYRGHERCQKLRTAAMALHTTSACGVLTYVALALAGAMCMCGRDDGKNPLFRKAAAYEDRAWAPSRRACG